MADYSTISRIAKILARATSPEPNEAKSALDHAYKRMVRDSVTLADLLTLPEAELFQDTLVRLVEVILANQANLSPPAKRTAYAEYMRLIVAKFSGAGEGASTSRGRSREDDAREYRERHGYKEEPPKRENAEAEKQKNDKSFTQKNDKTEKRGKWSSLFKVDHPAPVVEVLTFIWSLFTRGGLIWLFFHEPVVMFRLLGASILWGMGFAIVIMTVVAFGHIVTNTNPSPPFNFGLRNLFSCLTVLGTIWRYRLFLKNA
jgi:hypothetical protein